MEILVVFVALGFVCLLGFASWYRPDAKTERQEIREEVSRLEAEAKRALLALEALQAERRRIKKEMEKIDEELHRM